MIINQLAINAQSNLSSTPQDMIIWELVDRDENINQLHKAHKVHKALMSHLNGFNTHA